MPIAPASVLTVENRIPDKQVLLPRDQIDQNYYLSEKALTGIQNKK